MLLITRDVMPQVLERAKREHEVRELRMEGAFDPQALLISLEGVNAILCNSSDIFNAALINALPPQIKVIATYSVGLEHIDLAAAKARGIEIRNTPGVLSDATAELALTLMLMAARRAGEGERLLRARKWQGISPTFHLGRDVFGKTLGIFGMGRIGQSLARMARGLNMTIHYYNRNRLPAEQEEGAIYHADDKSFLEAIDFLSINAPGGPSTYHWLNEARIGMMRLGSFVVNTGRGSTVDDEALIAALRSGHIAAAGLDVFENEPDIHQGYYELENAVLLPHIGSATVETRTAMGFLALDGLNEVVGVDRDQ
ncbi:2-hydroxyacid dehydrogenase [Acidocella aminolytica]|jgi:lactate dehydrogenase-like 2-hydroxyacid dehydrogenase|uniref:Dehydrogenase/glyoxylate reductase n=1 Tax=Acidocella aminolytica 101 = DSM 11237 TaxID=1120923 RepID=A0A0D6PBI1_9PROT|nr:D-glycerate dehydrogenase [Acidocella aminolytica]GAN78701.1 dehydrogenase/glyoxylate reductase [Acidocella aminolytica 101 = DSM 11237]GBQ33917.1 D-isomer specific 2-hydroxyacid dehydrogenase [Acidocella aminolytica 101 = DSM 11237]SHE36220.1 Lactate dehydrogenase [Acidocella aminolytica 101 = DSM 11237]